jgi:hypothetical protein
MRRFKLLVDTCTWLDLAQDQRSAPLIEFLEVMVTKGVLTLIVPRTVLDEFQKNKAKVAQRAQRSLTSHFNQVRDAIRQSESDTKQKNKVINYLSDLDHKIPLVGGMATATLERIEALLKKAPLIEISMEVKAKAADRALKRLAPCHHDNKNAIADAVIIEVYFDEVAKWKPNDRFAFVTHNKNDFSDLNQKVVHPDLAPGFSRLNSLYFISLGDWVRRIDPGLAAEVAWEYAYEQEVRSLSDILEAMDTLTTQVWYNRHKNLAWEIENGKHKIVSEEEWEKNWQKKKIAYSQHHTIDTVWRGAQRAAIEAEKKLGKGNYGPWTDFEWGMLNGKLSALRWALGDEWDMLDT